MRPGRAVLVPLFGMACAAVLAGCGGGSEGPEAYPVTGRVTYKGQPVAGALVVFHAPASGGQDAQTYTDEAGNFDVSIYVDAKTTKRGMAPGDYRVSIRKLDTEAARSTMRAPKNLLPEKYASPETSGLTATVQAGDENELEFALDS